VDETFGSKRAGGRVAAAVLIVSGGGVLVVEIIGAKLLSPFFGNSHFVWTNQILTTLAALAAGAQLGGRMADTGGAERWMPRVVMLAGWWLLMLIPVFERANYFFLRFHVGPGALLAASVLYFAPLTLLGTVPPMAVKSMTVSLQDSGRAAARALALATLGGGGWLPGGGHGLDSNTNE